jgi:hypothetical protein
MESEFIEMRMMKMQMIQFGSTLDLIQMKLMKVCNNTKKHDEERISILRGISINSSEDDENADDSIRFNPEFDSNEIDAKNVHDLK